MNQEGLNSRLRPTKGAAIALLLIDVVLLAGWFLFSRKGSWFPIIYLPMLAAVVLGVLMSGYGRRIGIALNVFTLSVSAAVFVGFKFGLVQFNHIDAMLRVGWVLIGAVGAVVSVFAIVGWILFFSTPKIE